MREKVIDIHPPSRSSSKKKAKERSSFGENKARGVKKAIGLIFLVLLLLGAYFYYASYHTEVILYPHTQKLSATEEILARATGALGENEIRGVVFEETLRETVFLEAEGRELVERRAQGEINICQDYTESSHAYREGTRFASPEGLIFESKERFTLPALSAGGCTQVNVIAKSSGGEYNLEEDTEFSLPGLEGTNIYENVKGESFTLVTEGINKEIPYVSEEEKENVQNEIKEKLLEEGKSKLESKHEKDYFLEEYEAEITEREILESEENEDIFQFKVEVKVRYFGLEKEALEEFVEKFLPEGNVFVKGSKKIDYEFQGVNFEEKIAHIYLVFSAIGHKEIDEETLKRSIAGADFAKAREVINQEADLRKMQLRNHPFGLNKVFQNLSRVKIIFEFDKTE